jgi:RND superfamily putative drug exporter
MPTATTHPDAPAAPHRSRAARRDRLTILVWLAVVIGGLFAGSTVFDRLSSATDPAPTSQSQQARHRLEAATGERDSILAVITDTPQETVAALAGRLRQIPGVRRVRSSTDRQLPTPNGGGITLAVGIRADLTNRQVNTTVDAVRHQFRAMAPGRVLIGGYPVLDRDLGTMARKDLARAEALALPIVLILLGLLARSTVGTLLGLGLVTTTVAGAVTILLALSTITEVSTFAVNVVTMFGIGLAVDYTLLLVTRFRRERAHTASIPEAVTATMATSGRTVALSGVTVAAALAGLLVFAEPVVRSMAYGGLGAITIAVASARTLLPALLRRFGHRLPPSVGGATGANGFARLARLVQDRPALCATASVGILILLAVPLTNLTLQGVDVRSLPTSTVTRHDADQLAQRLPALANAPISVVADTAPTDPRLTGYLNRLRGINHVTQATIRGETYGGLTVVDVAVDGPAGGADAIVTVDRIRLLHPGFPTAVTGLSARFTDFIHGLTGRAPYAGLLIAVATFLTLLLATGGLLVAGKAVLMNLVSLAASLGALVWAFQQGHLAGPLQFTPTGGLSLVIIVLTAVFAFGLSTDYEVFLLADVLTAHHGRADTNTAVALGIQRTGRLITTAAALIIVVFAGFATSNVLIITQLGLGLATAILLDATVVRLILTPALMTLLGRHNWTGPAWAQRVSRHLWHDIDSHVV